MHYTVLYTLNNPLKKNKVWLDGSLKCDGNKQFVLIDVNGNIILRELYDTIIHVGDELILGSYLIQVEHESQDKTRRAKKYLIEYHLQSDTQNQKLPGMAEFDGKSMVVFKTAEGKQLCRKICPGLQSGEQLECGRYVFIILGEYDGDVEKRPDDQRLRKTLVSKSASIMASAGASARTIDVQSIDAEKSAAGSLYAPEKKTLNCIYTEDKQKKQKKWIDGVITFKEAGFIEIANEETGECVGKRKIDSSVLSDGYEFDVGRWRVQIVNPVLNACTPNHAMASKRKPMLSVKELQEKKQKLLNKTSKHIDENEFTKASYANIKNKKENDDNELPIQQLTKTKKDDSLFDIFDD